MTDQPDFIYFECSECGFDSIQHKSFKGTDMCPICAEDNGRDVSMSQRVCRDTDKPEGRDARIEMSISDPLLTPGEGM